MLAVIRIRGTVNISRELEDTLKFLRLTRVNHCVLVPKTKVFDGMIQKVKDYVTWGEISPEMLEKLVSKRAEKAGGIKLDAKEIKEVVNSIKKEESTKNLEIKPVFRLTPPSKGFKPIRQLFPKGALGDRGDKINKLLERMI